MTRRTVYKTDFTGLTLAATAGIRNMAGPNGIAVTAIPAGSLTVSPTSLEIPFDTILGFVFSSSTPGEVDFQIVLKNPGGTDSIMSVSAYAGVYITSKKTQEGFPFDLAVASSSSSPPQILFNALAVG